MVYRQRGFDKKGTIRHKQRNELEIQKTPAEYKQYIERWLQSESREAVAAEIREVYTAIDPEDNKTAAEYTSSLAVFARSTEDPLLAFVAESYIAAVDRNYELTIDATAFNNGIGTQRELFERFSGESGNKRSHTAIVEEATSPEGVGVIPGVDYRFVDGAPQFRWPYENQPFGRVDAHRVTDDHDTWGSLESLTNSARYGFLDLPEGIKTECGVLLQPEVMEYLMRELQVGYMYPETLLQLAELFKTQNPQHVRDLFRLNNYISRVDHGATGFAQTMPADVLHVTFSIFQNPNLGRMVHRLLNIQDFERAGVAISSYRSIRENLETAVRDTELLTGVQFETTEHEEEFMQILMRRSEEYLLAQFKLLTDTDLPFDAVERGIIDTPFQLILHASYREWHRAHPESGPKPVVEYKALGAEELIADKPHFLNQMKALYYLGWPDKMHIPQEFVEMMDEAAENPGKAGALQFYCALENMFPKGAEVAEAEYEEHKSLSSFMYVKQVREDAVYVGGSNTRSTAAGQSLSAEIVGRILKDYNDKYILAEADSFSRTMRAHLENLGSVATECVIEEQHADGRVEAYFHTERAPGTKPRTIRLPHKEFRTRQLSALYEHDYQDKHLEQLRGRPVILRAYDRNAGGEALLAQEATQLLNNEGYVITRVVCLDDKRACNQQLVAFELPLEQEAA